MIMYWVASESTKPSGEFAKDVGVEYLRHHDLRHYFATKAVQSGIDMPTIAKWLGHSDGGVLAMKVYSNVMDEHAIHQSAKLNFTHMK